MPELTQNMAYFDPNLAEFDPNYTLFYTLLQDP